MVIGEYMIYDSLQDSAVRYRFKLFYLSEPVRL
jgi:hypothetical protein